LIGRFLNSLDSGILKNTIIVIFSEHGEMFAKHGRFGRAGAIRGTLYDDAVHVPLIIKIPGKEGRRVNGLAGLTDIMPTLLDILSVSDSQPVQGRSLTPLIDHNKPVNDFVYAGARYNLSHREPDVINYKPESINESVRNGEWKLIREVVFSEPGAKGRGGEEILELYDLKHDPDELHNCIDSRPKKAAELKERLRVWAEWCSDRASGPLKTRTISDKLLEDVKQHGYW
jgi:arylsulfatase A-like enzyme